MRVDKAMLKTFVRIFRDKTNLSMVILLAFVTIVTYGNSIYNRFVWDDHDIIVSNIVNREFSNIGILIHTPDSTVSGNQKTYYRPLNRFTYMIDYHLFGLKPAGYHIENIFIHLINVILLYLLGIRLFSKPVPAFIGALLFAVHPINSEAVNFISGRNNLLATFFVFSSFITYLHAQARSKAANFYLSALLFFMGLLSKEIALMLLVFFFIDIFSLQDFRQRVGAKIYSLLPFVVFTAVYLVMRASALSDVVGVNRNMQGILERLSQNIYIIPKYLSVILFPANLNVKYTLPSNYLADGVWLLIGWIAILAVCFFLIKGKSAPSRFGLLWLAINFIPISNIIPIPSAPMADRYFYLPAIGLWMIAADQLDSLYSKIAVKKTVIAATALVILCLAAVTLNRNRDWRDDISLFSSTVKVDPKSAWGHYQLGTLLNSQGRIDEAIEHFQLATKLVPDYTEAHINLGIAYAKKGWIDRAGEEIQIALRLEPDSAESYNNLGIFYGYKGQHDKAIEQFQIALKLKPDFEEAHKNLGIAYSNNGQVNKAIEHLQMALKLKPEDADAHNNLGIAYAEEGLIDQAIEHFRTAVHLNPADPDPRDNLNKAYKVKSSLKKAGSEASRLERE